MAMKIKREPLNVTGLLWVFVAISLLAWFFSLATGSLATGEDHPIYKASGIYTEKPKPIPKQDAPKIDLPPIKAPIVTSNPFEFLLCEPWFEVDHKTGVQYNVSVDHLFKDHGDEIKKLGITREIVERLNTDQRNRLHGKLHGELPQASRSTATTTTTTILPIVKAPATPSVAPQGYVRGNCPGGFCPAPKTSVYRRGRR